MEGRSETGGQPVSALFQAKPECSSAGMQVLAGDLLAAQESYWHYFALWKAFGALPERFLYSHGQLHSSQQQYPLRPELMESTFHLYQVIVCFGLLQ